jgi:hypothetical protein
MQENNKLPKRLRISLERELADDETIRWVEQPIPRFFTRSTVGICLSLLVPIIFFSILSFTTYQQAVIFSKSLFDFTGLIGIFIFLIGIFIPLILIFLVPCLSWLEARQTVYVITNKRAFILVIGGSCTTVTSFLPPELRVISRREHQDQSGDVIVYVHKSKDYDGDIQTQELGFKQVRNVKEFEKILCQLN